MTIQISPVAEQYCPFCESEDVVVRAFESVTPLGRKKHVVAGLQECECIACGEKFASESQNDYNAALIEAATMKEQSFLSIGTLKKFREKFCLSQRSASKLFGAGESSVGKWESGQLPSGPAALLIQCAIHVPGVTQFLGSLANVVVEESKDGLHWSKAEAPFEHSPSARHAFIVSTREHSDHRLWGESEYSLDELYGAAA